VTAQEREILHGVPVVPPRDKHADPSYMLADIKARPGVVVTEPLRECYLAVRVSACGTHVHYAGFEWYSEDDDGPEVQPLFVGNGTGGNLREMRHTYWAPGRDGYTFYLPLSKTIALLEALKQYFND
jgi:hypothetical protein